MVLDEPSIVAVNESTGEMEAAGKDAVELLRHSGMTRILPLEEGVVSDPDLAAKMLRYFLAKVECRGATNAVFPVPAGATKANLNALYNVAKVARVTKVTFVEKCLLAALGAGLPITEPSGCMVLDIGGGTADVALISVCGIVHSRSVRGAGGQMDEAIMNYLKRKYNFLIGDRTAEQIKIEIGSAYPLDRPLTMEIRGRNLIEGVPKTITVDDSEIRESLSECVSTIMNAIRVVLERTPPELSADISDRGIVLTGGGALLKNLRKRIQEETGLWVSIDDDPLSSVVFGAGKALSDRKLLERIRLYPR
jgi:rod shape-determining protein MreB